MIFNSTVFLIFFLVVFIIYWSIPGRLLKVQNLVLLVSSYFFYGWWDWRFLSLIALTTIVDYFVGQKIHSISDSSRRKRWLLVSVLFNLGLLATFKYFNFFVDTFVFAFNTIGIDIGYSTVRIILPVGISFYTFQTMSYSLDIYRRKIEPTKDPIVFATFVSLFPQLVAGPIERAANLIPQIKTQRVWKHENLQDGFLQILMGFFRKVVVADSIGALIDPTYASPEIQTGSTTALSIILYSFQIYFDFSGYSDIAIGSARLLGFNFKQNFNFPNFASSISEFWRRWHISLSSWLKDYLYIPLGGNRKGIRMQYRNIMLTMLIGGLWHGASWNFVVWGGLHGIFLLIEKKFNLVYRKFSLIRTIYVFILCSFTRIFFRAQSFEDSMTIISKLFSGPYNIPFQSALDLLANVIYGLVIANIFDAILFKKNIALEHLGSRLSVFQYVLLANFLLINILLFFSGAQNFIYFQF